MIILVAVAAVVVGAPIVAAVIVSYASLREESAYSLCSRPPGPLAAFARRLLSFQSSGGADMLEPRIPRPRKPAGDGPGDGLAGGPGAAPRDNTAGGPGAAARDNTARGPGAAPRTGAADHDTQPGQPFAAYKA
jgi:hypothetical protein